jgi:plasmid stabilization system protein ParE
LLEIGRFIARDKPDAARRWVTRLRQSALQAVEFPRSGRVVPELGRDDVREIVERGYRSDYRIIGDEIHVLTVFESHQLRRLARSQRDLLDRDDGDEPT